MRIMLGLLLLLMLLFGAVQYNDPDGLLWMFIYTVPAVWCGLGLLQSKLFTRRYVKVGYWVTVAMTLIGVVYFWPITPRFWTKEVWYNVETAREGMGLMIVFCVLLFVRFCVQRQHGEVVKANYKAHQA